MGGPAMIEAAGSASSARGDRAGRRPGAQRRDRRLVEDEAEAVAVGEAISVLFPGTARRLGCADQRLLRRLIPENRLRVYDIRAVIEHARRRGLGARTAAEFGVGIDHRA